MKASTTRNRVAIVTGAGSGIGHEIVTQLLNIGVCVVFNDIDPKLVQKVVDANDPDLCTGLAGDAGDLSFISSLVRLAISRFGRLDICICNAGITSYGTFLDFKITDFEKLVNLNLRGSFFLAQKAAQQMIKQGEGGRILFMSSVTGILAHPYLGAYGMTKGGLQMLAKALVVELAPYGITTNAIAPGAVETERTVSMDPLYARRWSEIIPTGRVTKPSDIAQLTIFLVSDQAAQINGQTFVVDGGTTSIGMIPPGMDQV